MTKLVSIIRLREKKDLVEIPTDIHRGIVALSWTKPSSFKVDSFYLNPGYTLNEGIRRVIDITGEFGNWSKIDGKPNAVGGDLVSVTFEVSKDYRAEFFLTKKRWGEHTAVKE